MPTPTRVHTVSYNTDGGNTISNATATYTFSGWYTAPTGGTRRTYTKMPAVSETLYAVWNNTNANITLPTPTKTGYTFEGWYSDSAKTTKVGSAGSSYTPTSNITLYAKWTTNTSTLSINPNGGSVIITSPTGGTSRTITSTQTYTQNYGTTLTYGTPNKTSTNSTTNYTVTYNYDGATRGASVTNATATKTDTTTYTFSSWTKSSSFYGKMTSTTGNGTYTYGATKNVTDTITANYTSGVTSNTTSITLPTPMKDGYTFEGWYSNSAKTIKVGNAGDKYKPIGNVTLYAKWKMEMFADVPTPNLTGFNKDTTFYVIYDEDGNESELIPITENPPSNWYCYSQQKWANIVVRNKNNGNIAYFVWIPRYVYKTDAATETVDAIFVDISNKNINTGKYVSASYELPESFTWGDDSNNLTQLTGFWISKYKLRGNYESKSTGIAVQNEAINWIKNIRQMENQGQIMGLSETIDTKTGIATSTANNIDVHMQKNTEYGTTVLLGASQYGKQGEGEERYMNKGSTAGGTAVQASTTGNVYGVYELGGIYGWEWVAGGTGSFLQTGIAPRYVNQYTTDSSSDLAGDATVETGNWHGTSGLTNRWVSNNDPVFQRGISSVFSYLTYYGSATGKGANSRAAIVSGTGI